MFIATILLYYHFRMAVETALLVGLGAGCTCCLDAAFSLARRVVSSLEIRLGSANFLFFCDFFFVFWGFNFNWILVNFLVGHALSRV